MEVAAGTGPSCVMLAEPDYITTTDGIANRSLFYNVSGSVQMSSNSNVQRVSAENASLDDGVAPNQQPPPDLSSNAFRTLVLKQLTRIQEQNDALEARIRQLDQDQQDFYVDTCEKLDRGFRRVDKGFEELGSMKEVFKEIVGIMSGERVRFIDHSNENITADEAEGVGESLLLASNFNPAERVQQAAMRSGRRTREPSVKQEVSEPWQSLNYPNFGAPSGSGNPGAGDEDEQLNDRAVNYRLNRLLKTVTDVAREYFEGLPGQPSVAALERRFGPSWRCQASERSFFAKRMQIINRIIDVKDHPEKYNLPGDITRRKAVRVVENLRLGNNSFHGRATRMTLNQLYIYLAKKMDKPEDYHLHLREFARPRRDLLIAQRNALVNTMPLVRDSQSPQGSLEEGIDGTGGAGGESEHARQEDSDSNSSVGAAGP
ncbi:LADA_0G09780g1_1 [Lachancea dasiensis]|uniref:LADA_0G09780g1_1 n=1 Tax=Lachancea dasiensis TaxID=1072105 RepID=A0A1G4JUI2_9SACH|nr:LADA_0G09780g1_1 [Lachancea dasiensis]